MRPLFLALALLAALTAPAQAADEPVLGVNVGLVFHQAFDGARWERHLAAVHQDGIPLARSDAFWQDIEPFPPVNGVHTYNWTVTDLHALTLQRHSLRWLPVLAYSAEWASSHPGHAQWSPPTDPDDYAKYAAAFAKRYGRGGDLWAAHPDLTPNPVTTYEIWNEPNFILFWQTGPDPARYADLYIRARAAIKAVDPQARVIVGGLFPSAPDDYVRAMYAARPELKGNVDGMGLHPYGATPAEVISRVRTMRSTLEQLGDPDVPIDVTEVGWVTSGVNTGVLASEDQRATYIEQVSDTLARSDCNVTTVIPYTWTTAQLDPANPEHWYGMVGDTDAARSATSRAYSQVVGRFASEPPDPANRTRICHPPPPPPPPPDLDQDGLPDATDPDDDGDGVPDVTDLFPLNRGESKDADGDMEGDNSDADDDADGLADWAELRLKTSPTDVDSDDDGLRDGAERTTSPAKRDTDKDGLPDGLEAGATQPITPATPAVKGTNPKRFRPDMDPRTRTSPVKRDTDKDGLSDVKEDRNRNGRRDRGETDPRRRN